MQHIFDPRRGQRRIRVCLFVLLLCAGSSSVYVPSAHADARSLKLELVDQLPSAPRILWVGTSTSREINPSMVRRLTGQRMFNGALSAARLYDAQYINKYIATKFGSQPHLVIALDVDQLKPRRIVRWRRRADGALPLATSEYTRYGFRKRNPLRSWEAAAHLPDSIRKYTARYRQFKRLGGKPKAHLRWALTRANAGGDTPTIVLMPIHPKLERKLRSAGRPKRRNDVKRYLRSLRNSGLQFRLLDLSNPRTIGAKARNFHDGVHPKAATANALLRYLDRRGLLAQP